MWFKKKSVLQGEGNYNSNTAVDGTDWRIIINGNGDDHWSVSHTLPSVADVGNYFYLPALGFYESGLLNSIDYGGYYWSSSAYSFYSGNAYYLYFYSGYVAVYVYSSDTGFRTEALQ